MRAMQRKQVWKLDGSGMRYKQTNKQTKKKKNPTKQQRQLFMRYHHSQPKQE